MLNSILQDPKFQLVYDELEHKEEIPPSSRIFVNGALIPYSALLLMRRKDLLVDTRILLPIWFSVPFLVSVIRFFKNLGRKKTAKTSQYSDNEESFNEETARGKDESLEMLNAAREIEQAMVPQNHTLDSYLEELKIRWVRLIDKQARENLVEDVNSLVRDNLRQTLRVHKRYKITRENLVQLAANILDRTPSLHGLGGKDSLRTYIELYLVKLLETVRFETAKN